MDTHIIKTGSVPEATDTFDWNDEYGMDHDYMNEAAIKTKIIERR